MRAFPSLRLAWGLAVALALPGGMSAARAEWQWAVTPYFWAPDVTVDATLNEMDIGSTIEFASILDKADAAAILNFEGRKGRAGFFADAVYLSLADGPAPSGNPAVPAGTNVSAELDQLIAEAGGIFRLAGGAGSGLDLLFGARVIDLEVDARLDFPDPGPPADRVRTRDDQLLDVFGGLRYGGAISERWVWSLRGDVGAGDTDLTWQGILLFGLKLGKDLDNVLFLGYRHLAYEFEVHGSGITALDLRFTGPAVGFRFGF
jgi:hypothetical protein